MLNALRKENNGILKLYVDGTLAGAAYDEANRFYAVHAADITVSDPAAKFAVYDVAFGYDELNAAEGPEPTAICNRAQVVTFLYRTQA